MTEAKKEDVWLVAACCGAVTLQLLRLSIDLIQNASLATSEDFSEEHHNAVADAAVTVNRDKDGKPRTEATPNKMITMTTPRKSPSSIKKTPMSAAPSSSSPAKRLTYGSSANDAKDEQERLKDSENGQASNYGSVLKAEDLPAVELADGEAEADADDDDEPLLPASSISLHQATSTAAQANINHIVNHARWSARAQTALAILFLWEATLPVTPGLLVFPPALVWTAFVTVILNAWLTFQDLPRRRFGTLTRILYFFATATIYIPIAILYYSRRTDTTMADELLLNGIGVYVILCIVEVCFVIHPSHNLAVVTGTTATRGMGEPHDHGQADSDPHKQQPKKQLSTAALWKLLKPYFWPDETSETAATNRIRAVFTWVCVIFSKVCNLVSPILLGWAMTALATQDYKTCIVYSIWYSFIGLIGAALKEGQSLVYLKVAQAAFVQLSETTFEHLHSLSLDWHLRKKLGEVIRSMDRGIDACDTLMKYLFLWLVPALAECLVVCIIFATYFSYLPMAVAVFYFVWVYIVWTILVTLWRKKFRKAVVQSDNEWHDRCTDSLLNFETVKYFTAEEYERKRFAESVEKYQTGSVQVQASLSFLNVSQRLILQVCLATALSMAAWGIKKRNDCCLKMGCDSAISQCCQNMSSETCPGMNVGDFIAVLTYTLQLFAPLNFLGSVYNAVVMAVIDLTNLSQLLAESPDVTDAPGATALPMENSDNPDIAVEFENVWFHYPTQSSTRGLRGVSFSMKRGTTTAIVGPTGAGKNIISVINHSLP